MTINRYTIPTIGRTPFLAAEIVVRHNYRAMKTRERRKRRAAWRRALMWPLGIFFAIDRMLQKKSKKCY